MWSGIAGERANGSHAAPGLDPERRMQCFVIDGIPGSRIVSALWLWHLPSTLSAQEIADDGYQCVLNGNAPAGRRSRPLARFRHRIRGNPTAVGGKLMRFQFSKTTTILRRIAYGDCRRWDHATSTATPPPKAIHRCGMRADGRSRPTRPWLAQTQRVTMRWPAAATPRRNAPRARPPATSDRIGRDGQWGRRERLRQRSYGDRHVHYGGRRSERRERYSGHGLRLAVQRDGRRAHAIGHIAMRAAGGTARSRSASR